MQSIDFSYVIASLSQSLSLHLKGKVDKLYSPSYKSSQIEIPPEALFALCRNIQYSLEKIKRWFHYQVHAYSCKKR